MCNPEGGPWSRLGLRVLLGLRFETSQVLSIPLGPLEACLNGNLRATGLGSWAQAGPGHHGKKTLRGLYNARVYI